MSMQSFRNPPPPPKHTPVHIRAWLRDLHARRSLTEKNFRHTAFPQKLGVIHVGVWQLALRRLAVGGWWPLAAVGGWRLVVGVGWWLAFGGSRRVAVGSGWRLVAVGGWWSLRVILSRSKGFLQDRPACM